MAGGMLDLEKHFAFYGAYHSNKVNVAIHMIFVWPIFFTALVFLALLSGNAPLIPLPLPAGILPLQNCMIINWSFVLAGSYALFYAALDKRAGSLAAFLCLICWVFANLVAQKLGYSLGMKFVFVAQIICWTFQFIGHGVFERRAPALIDNLVQALVMAPFFVLLEALNKFLGYEPYTGFMRSVRGKVGVEISKFKSRRGKP